MYKVCQGNDMIIVLIPLKVRMLSWHWVHSSGGPLISATFSARQIAHVSHEVSDTSFVGDRSRLERTGGARPA